VCGTYAVQKGPHAGENNAEAQRHYEHGEINDPDRPPSPPPLLWRLQIGGLVDARISLPAIYAVIISSGFVVCM